MSQETAIASENKRENLIIVDLAMAIKAVLSGDDSEASYDFAETVLERYTRIYGEPPDFISGSW